MDRVNRVLRKVMHLTSKCIPDPVVPLLKTLLAHFLQLAVTRAKAVSALREDLFHTSWNPNPEYGYFCVETM